MPEVKVVAFKEADGGVPLYESLDALDADCPSKARSIKAKVRLRIERLKELGHGLHSAQGRGEAAHLRDKIYELRKLGKNGNMQYRILYFFYRDSAVVLSHGLFKAGEVPPREIDKALERRRLYEQSPARHTAGAEPGK